MYMDFKATYILHIFIKTQRNLTYKVYVNKTSK